MKDDDFYVWYKEEIDPLIAEIKSRMQKRSENLEYVFVVSEPGPNSNVVPTMTDYCSKECSLPYLLVNLIEAQLIPEDRPNVLN